MKKYKYTIKETMEKVGIGHGTFYRWYKWYNDEKYTKPEICPKLPKPRKVKGKKCFTESDIDDLILFKTWVRNEGKGIMAEVSRDDRYRPTDKSDTKDKWPEPEDIAQEFLRLCRKAALELYREGIVQLVKIERDKLRNKNKKKNRKRK